MPWAASFRVIAQPCALPACVRGLARWWPWRPGIPASPALPAATARLQKEAESYMTEIESVGQAYEDAQVGVPSWGPPGAQRRPCQPQGWPSLC